MEKVKELLRNGLPLSLAVKAVLAGDAGQPSRSLSRVALERGVNGSDLSAAINGTKIASPRMIEAMVAEFGGTVEEWRQLFSDAMQRRAAAAVGQ